VAATVRVVDPPDPQILHHGGRERPVKRIQSCRIPSLGALKRSLVDTCCRRTAAPDK
jgi:hypothetical protein